MYISAEMNIAAMMEAPQVKSLVMEHQFSTLGFPGGTCG